MGLGQIMNGVNEGQLTIWPEYELTIGVPVDAANDVSTGPEGMI